MSGLVGYGSSDEEGSTSKTSKADERTDAAQGTPHDSSAAQTGGRAHIPDLIEDPQNVPSAPSGPAPVPSLGPVQDSAANGSAPGSAPTSPYTSNRSTIRSMTLPPVPNLDIPPSPPSSPAPELDAKLTQFLRLKKQGVHFNSKLAASSALKNPSLLPKLMESAGLDPERDQYITTLPKDVWDPGSFPAWAYKEELAKAQEAAEKKREVERRGAERTFVPASSKERPEATGTSRNASAAERVMAGLERRGPR